MKTTTFLPIVAALLALAACAPGEDVFAEKATGYVEDVPVYLNAVDWSKVQTLEVALSAYAFTPEELTFDSYLPYRLRLKNTDNIPHYFASEGFFKAIAVKKMVTPAGETTAPYLEVIMVKPGETKELDFVPVKTGKYGLKCIAPFHADFGMTGTIAIL